MTTALCFDQASVNTGWTFGGNKLPLDKWTSGRFRAPKRDEDGERLIIIHDTALELIDRFDPNLVVYEQPFDPTFDSVKAVGEGKEPRIGFSRSTMNLLQMVRGAIIMAAARRSVPTENYPTRSWQSTLKLPHPPANIPKDKRSKWKKEEVRRIVLRMGGKVETLDESDSWGLCFHVFHGQPGMRRATADLFEKAVVGL